MKPVHKIYVRSLRDELGRYPNWPIQRHLALGKIGFYNGREAAFDWVTSLEDLGININAPGNQSVISEIYTTTDRVSFDFGVNANQNVARFKFKKNRSIATQGYELSYAQLQTGSLLKAILRRIKEGLEWNTNWLIITELWQAGGFTALVSGSSGSATEISTQNLIQASSFNIADINLGLTVTKSENMSYQGVAKENVYPYFDVHRLIADKSRGYYLKKYARDEFSAYLPTLDDIFDE